MKLYSINAGNFKLDGGAMYGVVPKSIWNKLNPADDKNLCTWSTRCLLIEQGKQLILIDTGLGNKQDESFFKHYDRAPFQSWNQLLKPLGFHSSEITDVFLTHLHFDHVGGALQYNEAGNAIETTFSNAVYWSHSAHWDWALTPNAREKASFLKDNIAPLQQSGQLQFVSEGNKPFEWMEVVLVDGHTEKQMLPLIDTGSHKLFYAADLLPSAGHIPLPYVMSYDVRPLLTLQEKEQILSRALAEKWTLFFEHDPSNECCQLTATDKGIRAGNMFKLTDLL